MKWIIQSYLGFNNLGQLDNSNQMIKLTVIAILPNLKDTLKKFLIKIVFRKMITDFHSFTVSKKAHFDHFRT
jgi:hypothetical protein